MLFILGIIACEYLPIDFRISAIINYFILGLFILLTFSRRINNFINGILVIVIFFSLGYANLQERGSGHSTKRYGSEECIFTLRVDKIFSHKKHKKCIVKILSHKDKTNELIANDGKLLVYFKDLVSDSSIVIGNEYLVRGKLIPIQQSNNPHSFDYAEFLKRTGIQHQLFLDESQFSLVRKNQNTSVDRLIQSIRNHCINIFQKYFHDQNKLGILYAMVLGKRDGIDEQLNQAFVNTGAIHVLAVSGLHVGILCMFVTYLFRAFEFFIRISKLKRGILSVTIIWAFAFITGASPAVCRAALMFSLFYIAKDILHRKVSVYNVLAGTALILLIINPNQLFQIGFQFSFLAVLSIVFFYPFVNGMFTSRYKLINYLYSSVCIGIAAQILVFPLGIFYFNKFANSFLITSLFVVQFAMVILIGGLAILIFESIGLEVVNHYVLVTSMDFILEKFEDSIFWVQSMPFSSSGNLWLDWEQLIIIYLLITSCMYYLKGRKIYIYAGLIFFYGLINYTIHQKTNKELQQIAYIYDAKDICVDIFIGKNALHLGPTLEADGAFIYSRNRLAHSIDAVYPIEEKKSPSSFEYDHDLIRLGNHIIAFANVETLKKIKKDQKLDYVLVSRGHTDLEKLNLDQLRTVEIILDGSVKFWEREKILGFAKENGLKVHDVKVDGAKEISF